ADAVRRVGLDAWSLAGANLARVLLKHRWGAEPEFVPIDPLSPPREDKALDAFLLIGDNALREPPGEFYVLDLGEEWTAFTGKPFVYALWVFRPGAGGPGAVKLLQEAKAEGLARLEEILARARETHPFLSPERARRYLTEAIRYDVGPEEEEGLRLYYDYLVEDGLAPPGWRPIRLGGPERARAAVNGSPEEAKPAGGGEKMANEELCYLSVHDLSIRIQRREISPVEAVEAHLRRIEALNPKLNAFLTVTADRAREEAKRAEAEIAAGRWRGPLHGVPYGAKDIIETAGIRTTHGSSFFRDHVPAQDAECIVRLRLAGAILTGKCHTHEFASAPTNVNPHYGPARNPWKTDRITGGSSGGSAAAVAAGLAAFALGSDTGGSIRNPAALCGVVGLKPTHGRISILGVCPNVLTLDHLGPITRTCRDAALALQALAGYDPRDPTCRDAPVPGYTAGWERGVRGFRLVLCPDLHAGAEVDEEVARAFAEAVQVFEGLGARVETARFPNGQRLLEAFRTVSGPEYAEFHRPFYEKNPAGYGADVRERVEGSFKVTADEYVRGLRQRELLRREMAGFFRGVDAVLTPSMPCAAMPIATLKARLNGKEVDGVWIHRPFLSAFNMTGCPAVSLPMGFSREGLPLSLQIAGPEWSEAKVLSIAHAYEEATPEIRMKRPPIG
ncbi:MAG: MqnA/MqnD/SBP family protein, partial [Nitrospinota bacterium]